MNVVSDTTAITTLLKAGEERLLPLLFRTVIVPKAVADELLAFHAQLPEFLVVQRVSAPETRLTGTESLGRGETEAIHLAKEIGADLLLIDDRKGRVAAQRLGIRCSGLPALVIEAKARGHVTSVRVTLERFERFGGFYLSPDVQQEALRQARELQ